ncbi:MAG: hypothetical protein PF486_06165 [Prolixibacteraceae bacterium]|jgi:hypothetical protein|nr:hypothetical protein [Prolixibacteraceae bacterium]
MIIFGKVKEIANNFIKALIYGKSDVRTAPQSLPFGIDSKPVKDKIAVYCQMENRSKSVMLGFLSKSDKTNPGEMRIYATDQSGNEVFAIMMDNDGNVTFDGAGVGTDNLVAYSKLNTGLSNQDTLINTELTGIAASLTAINSYLTGLGVATSPYVKGTVSTNISSSKIDKIKTS